MRTPTKSPPELQTATKLYGRQRHELIRTEPYKRVDAETELLVWECPCPVCSDTFEVRKPSRARTFKPNRRRQKRKRPGMRVKARGAA